MLFYSVEFTLTFAGGVHKIIVNCVQNFVGKLADTIRHQGIRKRLMRSRGVRVLDVMTC